MLDAHLDTVFADCIRSEADLFPDQREAVEFLWKHPFSALYLDVGLGKTAISYTIIDRLWLRGYTGKILVVAPIRVATRVWPFEPRLWSQLAYLTSTVIRIDDNDPRLKRAYHIGYQHGRAQGYEPDMCRRIAQRMETKRKHELLEQLLDSPEQIHIINREAVNWLVERCAERGEWPYKVVFVDEASCLGDHQNIIFKALKRVRPYIKRLHELTASPASQTYMRFFSQIALLDGGERFGKNITPFRERFFTYNRYSRRWTLRPGGAEEIERLISDVCLVMRREKNFQVNIRPIRLSPAVMEAYRQFERDLVLELPEDKFIDAINSAVLSNKLLQFASGAVYDSGKQYHVVHDEKIEELRSLYDETLDHPILVAYWYKSSLARLRKAFPRAAIMDKEGKLEEGWNKGKFKMLLVHPRSVAHGLNLQYGGHHLILYDIFWPLDLFTQLIGRLDRQGQKSTVVVHLLSAVSTMDETVAANLQLLRNAEESMFRRLQALRRL